MSCIFLIYLIFYWFSSDFASVLGVGVCMVFAGSVVGFVPIWVGVSPICQSLCPYIQLTIIIG